MAISMSGELGRGIPENAWPTHGRDLRRRSDRAVAALYGWDLRYAHRDLPRRAGRLVTALRRHAPLPSDLSELHAALDWLHPVDIPHDTAACRDRIALAIDRHEVRVRRDALLRRFTGARPVYLRYGLWGERSVNHRDRVCEDGVSVYPGYLTAARAVLVDLAGIEPLTAMAYADDPWAALHVVDGQLCPARGADGEPLLRNVTGSLLIPSEMEYLFR